MELLTPFDFEMSVFKFVELSIFYDPTNFINEIKKLDIPIELGGKVLPVDMNLVTFGQTIDLEEIKRDFIFTPLKVLCSFTEEEISTFNAAKVIRYSFHVDSELVKLEERDAKELHYEPDEDQVKAGFKKLNHGVFGTIDNIARRMGIDHEKVLELSRQKIFMMLKIDLDNMKYQTAYRNIIYGKK